MPASEPTDFAAVAAQLYGLKPRGTKHGIDRMCLLCAELGYPERALPVVHVAGTNGKGSVSAMLDAILRAAGWRTGLYTSPHLVHLGERVQVNREPLTEREILEYMDQLRPLAEKIAARAGADDQPSFFEYLTAMAFLQFARQGCDIAVLEVGLGGRLDATNVVTPEVAVITSIGLDHCEYLGDTVEKIAAEKAGIIKAGRPVVIGRLPPVAERVVREIAAARGAPLRSVREEFGDDLSGHPTTNLEGDYQRWNAATATLAARTLPPRWRLTDEAVARGLLGVEWAGRWQRMRLGGRTIILDASHNPEGASVLDRNFAQLAAETGRAPVVITGVLGAERAGPLLEVIARHAGAIHLVVPQQPRACTYDQMLALVPASFRGEVSRARLDELFPERGRCAVGGPEDTVVVTGSIYLLGEVLARVTVKPV